MATKITIITICLNEINSIKKTCNSVVNLLYENYEWIIIDGGSKDGTVEYLSKFKDKITHLVSEKDNGIYHAMNKGIKLSSGNYLIFLNAGDYFYSNRSLDCFTVNRREDFIYGDLKLNSDGKIKKYEDIINLQKLKKRNAIPHQATFYNKNLFDRIGLYDESFLISGDYEFNIRIFKYLEPTYQHIPEPISVFINNGISSNKEFKKVIKRENHIIRKKYFPSYLFSFKGIRESLRFN